MTAIQLGAHAAPVTDRTTALNAWHKASRVKLFTADDGPPYQYTLGEGEWDTGTGGRFARPNTGVAITAAEGGIISGTFSVDALSVYTPNVMDVHVWNSSGGEVWKYSAATPTGLEPSASPRVYEIGPYVVPAEYAGMPLDWTVGLSAVGTGDGYDYTFMITGPGSPFDVTYTPPVVDVAPEILTATLPTMTTGVPVSVQLDASGSPVPTWTATAGEIPGLTLSTAGLLAGTPTTAGPWTLTVRAENTAGHDETTYSGNVLAPPVVDWVGDLAARVACHLNRDDDDTRTLARCHVETVGAFVEGFTRGEGWTDAGPTRLLAAVIVTATARLTANPEQLASYTAGDYSERPAILAGWTGAELAVLRRYRKVTA